MLKSHNPAVRYEVVAVIFLPKGICPVMNKVKPLMKFKHGLI